MFLRVIYLQDKLSQIFPHLKITVASKADSTYPIVSAASICAKVIRDFALQAWKFPEEIKLSEDRNWGSGYPNGKNISFLLVLFYLRVLSNQQYTSSFY